MLQNLVSGIIKEAKIRLPRLRRELTVDTDAANFAFVVAGSAQSAFERGDKVEAFEQIDRVKRVLAESGLDAIYEARWHENKPPELRPKRGIARVKEIFPPRSGSFTTFRYRPKILGFF